MEFLKNPFKVKFLPVLFAALVGVVFFAFAKDAGDKAMAVFCWGLIAASQVLAAGRPLNRFSFWGFLVTGSFFGSLAVMSVFAHAYLAAAIGAVFTALPISIVYTRPSPTKE